MGIFRVADLLEGGCGLNVPAGDTRAALNLTDPAKGWSFQIRQQEQKEHCGEKEKLCLLSTLEGLPLSPEATC